MRLLIVDDDYQIREGMKVGIKWNEIGIDEVETCSNGLLTMESIKKCVPDIIVADIQMPGMTGIELVEKIREISKNIKIIFISAHSDFEFCKKAILLGANDYILKPIQLKEFMPVIQKNLEELKKERDDIKKYNQLRIKQVLEKMYERNYDYNEKEFIDILQTMFPTLDMFYFITVLIKIDFEIDSVSMNEEEFENELRNSLKNEILLVTKIENNYYCICPAHNSILLNLYIKNSVKEILLKWNKENVSKKICITAGISDYHSKNDFSIGFFQAKKMLEKSFYYNRGIILFYDNFFDENKEVLTVEKIELNEIDKLAIDEVALEKIVEKSNVSITTPNIFKEKLVEYIWQVFGKHIELDVISNLKTDLNKCEFAEECVKMIKEKYSYPIWIDEELIKKEENYSNTIKLAVEFIRNNYRNQITVMEISEIVGKSPNYFSSIFKNETGKSFTKFLNNFRLEKAKWLLLHTNKQVHEIATEVGYIEYVYFSKLFKEYFDCSATEMRENSK